MIETEGHPLVYADWLHAAGKPTVLCYGHYDVQPPDPLDEWLSPPFEPTERNGNLYARGAVDDKGQVVAQVKALESLLAANRSAAAERPRAVRRRRRSGRGGNCAIMSLPNRRNSRPISRWFPIQNCSRPGCPHCASACAA